MWKVVKEKLVRQNNVMYSILCVDWWLAELADVEEAYVCKQNGVCGYW